jgi:hypothetical protein
MVSRYFGVFAILEEEFEGDKGDEYEHKCLADTSGDTSFHHESSKEPAP